MESKSRVILASKALAQLRNRNEKTESVRVYSFAQQEFSRFYQFMQLGYMTRLAHKN
jgi:hypothetical protein